MRFLNKPGKSIFKIGELSKKQEPKITIITPFYNGGATLEETANTVLSQTYPYFEWIIIDDGSKSESCLKKLDEVNKWDERIKVYHKENGGPSQARDFGISKASPSTKYIYFLDCDDLIENTMLEEMYWALETHKDSSWVYTAMINFGAYEYYWEPYFTLEKELVLNTMCISSMIRKEDLLEVGCFGIKEKAMYEDWNLWLKLLSKGKKPIRLNSPLFWYRTSFSGELSRAKSNHKKAMKLINSTAKKVKNDVEVIQFPKISDLGPTDNFLNEMTLPEYKKEKKNTILFIVDNINLSKNSIATYETIKNLSSNNNCILLLTEPSKSNLRQDIKNYVLEIHDLSNFIDTKDYPLYVEYLISSRNVNLVVINNASYGYAMLPLIKEKNPDIKIADVIETKVSSIRTNNIKNLIDKTFTTNIEIAKNSEFELVTTNKKKSIENKSNINLLKDKYGISKEKPIVSYIDNIVYEKQPQLFINIAKKMKDNACFIINGNGKLSKKVEEKISNLTNVIYIPEQEDFEVIYRVSDIVVNCSNKEGMSSTNYKALMNGVPVVTTSADNQEEIISEKLGVIVSEKSTTDDYVKAINKVIAYIKDYKNNVQEERIIIANKYLSLAEKINNLLSSKTTLKSDQSFMCELYTYYENSLREDFREKYLGYYKSNHFLTPKENIAIGPLTKKQKIRSFSIRHNVENEMAFGLNWIRQINSVLTELLSFVKNFLKLIIMVGPLIINIFKIALKFIRKLLSVIKQKLLSIISK